MRSLCATITASSALLVLCHHPSEAQTTTYNANNRLRPRIRRDVHKSGNEEAVYQQYDNEALLQMVDEQSFGDADQQIVGGEEAQELEYPYFVDLGGCGGSLIAPNLVLSAAHCGDMRGMSAIVGAYRKGDDTTEGATTVEVVDWKPYPYYDSATGTYDVALLRIDPAVNLDNTNVVLTLNSEDDLVQKEKLTVMGMGATQENGRNPRQGSALRDVTVEMIPNDVCTGRWWYGGRGVDDTKMCAGYAEGNKDACQGDSGSPLVRKIGNTHVQVGIVSGGAGCGGVLSPGVYARVEVAFEWIQTIGCEEWGGTGPLCDRSSKDKEDRFFNIGSSCEENNGKEIDFTLLTGEIIEGEVGWEIISVEDQQTVFTDLGVEEWETYQVRKCLPEGAYVLLLKSVKGNGLSGGGYSLSVDGRLTEESFEFERFTIKVIGF